GAGSAQRLVRRQPAGEVLGETHADAEDATPAEGPGTPRAHLLPDDQDAGPVGGLPGVRGLQVRAHRRGHHRGAAAGGHRPLQRAWRSAVLLPAVDARWRPGHQPGNRQHR
ncbi:hypothetical protein CRUP_025369, partial [Coryphaenoides rupestris]